MESIMKITVAGVGYVGLSVSVLLAQRNEVTAVTTTKEKAEKLNRFESTLKDKELEALFEQVRKGEKELFFSATTDKDQAYQSAEMIIVAVSTNFDEETGSFDTSAVEDVLSCVMQVNPEVPVVIKSTIPVGYTDSVRKRYPGAKILFSPEFLRESKALYDNLHPSRIIVGADPDLEQEAEQYLKVIRECLADQDTDTLIMTPAEVEAVKLFANSYLAMRIAFFNELDSFAMKKGMRTDHLIEGVCKDPRIGDFYNNPSFGYGGYCLPKDTKQMEKEFEGIPQQMFRAVVESNRDRKQLIADCIEEKNPKKAGIYRLTMKNESDNFRASAVQDIIRSLVAKKIPILIYEPMPVDPELFPDCEIVKDLDTFIRESDVILANRMDPELEGCREKVFTRDLFHRD